MSYRKSGDPTFKAATEKLQQLDNNTFKLHKTKTYEFLRPDSVVVTWEALQLAKTRSSSSSQGDSKTPIQVSLKDGKMGSILPDAPVPQYNSKMSKARKEELKCQKVAFNDKATYLKSWPEKQPRTGKSKCGFWGRRRSKREKAKLEVKEMASKKEVKSAKREVWWGEGWRKRKEEKTRLAEEEMARERERHLLLVSPLDLDAQVCTMMMMMMMMVVVMMMTIVMILMTMITEMMTILIITMMMMMSMMLIMMMTMVTFQNDDELLVKVIMKMIMRMTTFLIMMMMVMKKMVLIIL